MHRLIAFDLDGTLAPIGKGIETEDIKLLRNIESSGIKIAVCSGKPIYYLCGMFRQVGLAEPILIGENGAAFQIGIDLPPQDCFLLPISKESSAQLLLAKSEIINHFSKGIWLQPNESVLTVFPKEKALFTQIQGLMDSLAPHIPDLSVYRHSDSFDIVPSVINKYNGLRFLSEFLHITANEIIAVGDGENDIPMFEFAGISIKIGDNIKYETTYSFSNITDAIKIIISDFISR